jgi:serine O-acetyltransferase
MLSELDRINSKRELREWINYEGKKYNLGGAKRLIPFRETNILVKHQTILRKTEYYINTGNKICALIYRLRLSHIQNKYALHIPVNTCGKGLKIMHLGPILINGRTTVGKDCSLHINTALVAGGNNDEVPHLEDGVVVGIGAVVLGGVHIAKNIAIGANAVVNKSFDEEDIAIAGVPAHKISNNGRTHWK